MRRLNISILLAFSFFGFAQNPPEQPMKGPGGKSYDHDVRITQYGTDITDWYWLIEPVAPQPDSAEVVVFFHGTNSNMDSTKLLNGQKLFCEHIAKKGYTVIYPLYQYGARTLPFRPQLENAANVVKKAFKRLEEESGHAKPKRWDNGKIMWATTGISRGGGMSINMATHYEELGLPQVDAICAFVPGSGRQHEALDPNTRVTIVSAEEDDVNGPLSGHNAHREAWDSLWRIPCENKANFTVRSDNHGQPNIVAKHDCAGSGNDWNNRFRLNALDFFGSWKWSVGTFNCTFRGTDCEYVFENDTLARYMGKWSDGRLVKPSIIEYSCDELTSTQDGSQPHEVVIYPNPSAGVFTIEGILESQEVRVYDPSGRRVNFIRTDCTFHLETRKTGHFVVVLEQPEGRSEIRKVMVW